MRDAPTGSEWFADADADGYGNPTDSAMACARPEGRVDETFEALQQEAAGWASNHPDARALLDIAGVTASLGVAFNSTFVALLISMVVMFFMHQLQPMQKVGG